MANLKLEHIYKVYPNGTKAVNDFSLDIKNGEFIVFVGPSGCGKSTTLRMIAGLEEITAGELYIDSTIVNDMEPKDRDIAMVFQNYALYPHMTVYENMAFGLRLRHVPEDVIQEKVLWAADILGIKDYLDRKPRNMSGGQRQRVSLGRAILRDPKVMLLDEPLSNLDAKLRAQMRTEIAKLHQKLKTTFIYVTHDQTEAMTLGDRVVVMKGGRIQQVDTPKNLYNYPENIFVAGFIGTPQMNFLPCTLARDGEIVHMKVEGLDEDIRIDYNRLIKALPSYLDGKHALTLGIRSENISIVDAKREDSLPVVISHFEELGNECLIYGNLAKEDGKEIIIRVREIRNLKVGETIQVLFDFDKTYFFDKETEETILPRIPQYNSFQASIKGNRLSLLSESLTLPHALVSGDFRDGELQVPVDAVLFREEGLPAKVLFTEDISGTKLIHLECGGRVFFALSDNEMEEGREVHVNFDFTRITYRHDGIDIIVPLGSKDAFHANFFNYETIMAETNNAEFTKYREDKIKAASDYVSAEIALENKNYEEELHNLESQDHAAVLAGKKEELRTLTEANNRKIADLKKNEKEKLAELKKEFEQAKKDAKSKNDNLFREKKEKEEREYKEFLENNRDKATRKRRTDEYHIFRDNFQTDKDNTINRILNGMIQDYETALSKEKSEANRSIDLLKKEIKEKKKEVKVATNPERALSKDHEEKIKALKNKRAEAEKKASFVFFFQFDGGHYVLLPDIISNKLIQGLGTRVFTRRFRVDIPHDAYTIKEEGDGFKVIVESILDYGDRYYLRSSYTDDNGQIQSLFLESEKAYEVGTKLVLEFDLSRSEITETDMNIRLY